VIARLDGETVLADAEAGPPLGVGLGTTRTARSFTVEPGAVVVFYTDGLVERRDESLSAGLRRLCKVVEPGHPESVARTVMRELVGSTPPRDDIALVVVRRVATEVARESVRADSFRV
jgi:serine phosphatase RsbU (regulator of sigma subunit)